MVEKPNTKTPASKRQFGSYGQLDVIGKDIGIRQIRYLVEALVLAVIVGYNQHYSTKTVVYRQHFPSFLRHVTKCHSHPSY